MTITNNASSKHRMVTAIVFFVMHRNDQYPYHRCLNRQGRGSEGSFGGAHRTTVSGRDDGGDVAGWLAGSLSAEH